MTALRRLVSPFPLCFSRYSANRRTLLDIPYLTASVSYRHFANVSSGHGNIGRLATVRGLTLGTVDLVCFQNVS
jgi:hypothetical protein